MAYEFSHEDWALEYAEKHNPVIDPSEVTRRLDRVVRTIAEAAYRRGFTQGFAEADGDEGRMGLIMDWRLEQHCGKVEFPPGGETDGD